MARVTALGQQGLIHICMQVHGRDAHSWLLTSTSCVSKFRLWRIYIIKRAFIHMTTCLALQIDLIQENYDYDRAITVCALHLLSQKHPICATSLVRVAARAGAALAAPATAPTLALVTMTVVRGPVVRSVMRSMMRRPVV